MYDALGVFIDFVRQLCKDGLGCGPSDMKVAAMFQGLLALVVVGI